MKKVLTKISYTHIVLQISFAKENELGNLITNLMEMAVQPHLPKVDFVIINAGGLRTIWYPGDIVERDLYNMFPFVNYLESFEIKGSELVPMMKVLQSGKASFYPTKGLQTTVKITNGKK